MFYKIVVVFIFLINTSSVQVSKFLYEIQLYSQILQNGHSLLSAV